MTTYPRRLPYKEMYTSELIPPAGSSKRYSVISTHSALTTETPSTPPRTPSPTADPPQDRPRHLGIPGVSRGQDRRSRSLRRARSAERTRTWAEEVERQRSKTEGPISINREEREQDIDAVDQKGRLSSSNIWSVSTGVIDSLIHDYSSKSRHSSRLPSADEIISNLNRTRRPTPESSDSEGFGFGPAYEDDAKVRSRSSSKPTSKTRIEPPVVPPRYSSTMRPSSMSLARPVAVSPLSSPTVHLANHSEFDSRTKSPIVPPRSSSHLMALPTAHGRPTVKLKTTALSIDDIVRKHSSAIDTAMQNAKESAKRSMGCPPPIPSHSSPVREHASVNISSKLPRRSNMGTALETRGNETARDTSKEKSVTALRSPTHPTALSTMSPRFSKRSACLSEGIHPGGADSDEDVRASLAMGQALLEKLETASITSSPASKRSSAVTSPSSGSPRKLRSRRHSLTPARRSVDEENLSMALYLRSSRLNRYLHLPRPFPERPLRVSLADVGSTTGTPVLVFLGIGCVRHLIALFDDLAKALGIRLICIDRWGFGKTTNVPQERRNPLDWAAVVERVLDEIQVDTFRLVAHSAGVPYAAAAALRLGDRVQGKMHFLAPWISADIDGGYKWLKYVPNAVIKSAFAAEWKLHTYRLGKPPPLVHQPVSSTQVTPVRPGLNRVRTDSPAPISPLQRSTTLARRASQMLRGKSEPPSTSPIRTGLLGSKSAQIPSEPSFGTGTTTSDSSRTSFQLKSPGQPKKSFDTLSSDIGWLPPSPLTSRTTDKPPTDAALLQALEQASHAECEPGTTDDLITIILNRASLPWGFSYADLQRPATIWWGDQDERISERSVRWMERVMPTGTELKVISGADHNLMRSVPVMCEILQSISEEHKQRL